MRRKLFIGGLGVMTALLVPTGLGTAGTPQALDCPIGQLQTVCGAADLVISTACYQPLPEVPTVGIVTIDLEGGPPLVCPEI